MELISLTCKHEKKVCNSCSICRYCDPNFCIMPIVSILVCHNLRKLKITLEGKTFNKKYHEKMLHSSKINNAVSPRLNEQNIRYDIFSD